MWVNKKKHLGYFFRGNYELKKNGETHFHLICTNKKGRKWEIKFRSWQAAVKAGWLRIGDSNEV